MSNPIALIVRFSGDPDISSNASNRRGSRGRRAMAPATAHRSSLRPAGQRRHRPRHRLGRGGGPQGLQAADDAPPPRLAWAGQRGTNNSESPGSGGILFRPKHRDLVPAECPSDGERSCARRCCLRMISVARQLAPSHPPWTRTRSRRAPRAPYCFRVRSDSGGERRPGSNPAFGKPMSATLQTCCRPTRGTACLCTDEVCRRLR
jgi:hypothetical protein